MALVRFDTRVAEACSMISLRSVVLTLRGVVCHAAFGSSNPLTRTADGLDGLEGFVGREREEPGLGSC